MMLDDAVDERPHRGSPVNRHRRRGRGPSAGLLVITAAWTGCRWVSSLVLRPAVDGDARKGPIRPGFTFHGLRHGHKTWLIADDFPEIAQARRLGHPSI